MLAQEWSGCNLGRRSRELHRISGRNVWPAHWMLDLDDHLPRVQVRIVEYFASVLARPARHSSLGQDLHHLVFWSLRGPGFNQRTDFRHVLQASVGSIIARITDQILTVNGAQERVPHLLLRQDEHVIVRAAWIATVCGGR